MNANLSIVPAVVGCEAKCQLLDSESYITDTNISGETVISIPFGVSILFERSELKAKFLIIKFDELSFKIRIILPSTPPAIPVNVASPAPA